MRDPKRIDRILEKIKDFWKAYPDWRIGQLIFNLTSSSGAEDVFYVEDEIIEKELDKKIKKLMKEGYKKSSKENLKIAKEMEDLS